jgi:hypothetical protein
MFLFAYVCRVKAANLALGVLAVGALLYEFSRARFLADIQVRVVSVQIKGPLSLGITFEFMNPSPVTASINTVYAAVNVNGYPVASFQDTNKFSISPGISRKTLLGNIDPIALLELGLGSLRSLKRPIVAKVDGYAIGGAIKFPFSQTVNV